MVSQAGPPCARSRRQAREKAGSELPKWTAGTGGQYRRSVRSEELEVRDSWERTCRSVVLSPALVNPRSLEVVCPAQRAEQHPGALATSLVLGR